MDVSVEWTKRHFGFTWNSPKQKKSAHWAPFIFFANQFHGLQIWDHQHLIGMDHVRVL